MEKIISSPKNRHVTAALRLRDRRGRDQQGRIIVDGARELLRALEGGIEFLEVFYCSEFGDDGECDQVIRALAETPAAILTVTPQIIRRVAYGQRAAALVGIARKPLRDLKDLSLNANPLVLVLESVEKPGNVGAAIRTADGAGASAVIVADGQTDLFNPNTSRASLGAVFTHPLGEASGQETDRWLQEHGVKVFAARVDAEQLYTDQDFTGPVAIVLGNEASGLTPLWHATHVTPIQLPMLGTADSLNVSAAAAVLLYEARRQRSAERNI